LKKGIRKTKNNKEHGELKQKKKKDNKKKNKKSTPSQAKASQTRPPKNDLDFRPHPTHPVPKPKKALRVQADAPCHGALLYLPRDPHRPRGAEVDKRPGPLPWTPSNHVTPDGVDSVVGYIEKTSSRRGKKKK
jgi:hypothetical protein